MTFNAWQHTGVEMIQVDDKKFQQEIEDIGFTVHQNVFDKQAISELDEYAQTLKPDRGHDKNKKWYGWNQVSQMKDPENEVDWAYYWTPEPNHSTIATVYQTLSPLCDAAFGFGQWAWYATDFIVLQPGMNFYRPHIDTPYRFQEFRYSKELLGLQFMVMMCDFNENNGATGYVPGSHKYIYDPDQVRQESAWETFYADNYKQYTAESGSFVCWHPRLIHSTMPNKSDHVRRALLIHATTHETKSKLDVIDPQFNTSLRTS